MKTIEELIRETDALTFLNALKSATAELKEELSTIEETREYQNQAVDRARKIIRRIDNQYRAIVKATLVENKPVVIQQYDESLENFLQEDATETTSETQSNE